MTAQGGIPGRREVTGGRMTWQQAREGPLAGVTCLWQDLDGLHVGSVPSSPPPASVLWGWSATGDLLRARLDGSTVYLAQCAAMASDPMLPWAPADGRVASYRGPSVDSAGLGTTYAQVVVDGLMDGAGPITFVRPVQLPPTPDAGKAPLAPGAFPET